MQPRTCLPSVAFRVRRARANACAFRHARIHTKHARTDAHRNAEGKRIAHTRARTRR